MSYLCLIFHPGLLKDPPPEVIFPPSPMLDRKISLWCGDITHLEIDAIVNATNYTLIGGGQVDKAIHQAAGPSLTDECLTLNGCSPGMAKITSGHALPAKCNYDYSHVNYAVTRF